MTSITKLLTIIFVSISYIILGKLSISYITMPEGIAIVWLPNALILATFLLKDKKEWMWFIFAFLISEIIADLGSFTVLQALQFGIINVIEGLLSATLIKKLNKSSVNFQNIKYVISFISIALIAIPSFSALFGALVYKTQIESTTNFLQFWKIWFFGDALGILLLTPILVILSQKKEFTFKLNFESFFVSLITLILAFMIFSVDFNIAVLPSTPMIFLLIFIWITYRQGLIFSILLALMVISICIYFTVNESGTFSIFDAATNTLYLQEFIATLMMVILFFGVLLTEVVEKNSLLLNSNIKLEDLSKNLEKIVLEKTKSLEFANQKLQQLSIEDSLTKIYNRRFFEDTITKEIEISKRYETSLSLILLDIDFFKRINDNFGHQIGDEVLVDFTDLIKNNIRKTDIFSRIGGEEFALLLLHTNLEQAVELAIKLKNIVENNILNVDNQKVSYTISLGISTLENKEQTYKELFKIADTNLYKAKENGRNIVIY